MTRKIKILALLLALVMMLGVVAGCTDGETETPTESESESAIETESTGETEAPTQETTVETEPMETEASTTETTVETTAEQAEVPTTETETQTQEPAEPDTGWETLEDVKLEEEICAVTSEHCVESNWIPKVGTAREKKYCYYCGKEVKDRAAPFTIYAMNVEQSKYQTTIRSDKSTSGSIKFKISTGSKIVIPTTPEYNIVINGVGVTMTGNYDGTIIGNTIYYSVDGGATWAPCPGESGVLTIALTADMFTGDNAGNVDKALENGVKYGVIPGYNAEYVAQNPDKIADVMRTIIEFEKASLSKDIADAGGHNDDPALVVTLCEHKGDRTATKSDAGVYTYSCTTCGKDFGVSGTVKDSVNYFSTKLITGAATVGVQNGVVFARINPTGGATIKVSPIDGNVTLGKYVVVKYRAMGYGSLKAVWEFGGASKKVTNTISRAETQGWEVAVVNVESLFGATVYTDGAKGTFTLTFECEGVVDIAYVAMASDLLDLCAIMEEGSTFYHRGNSFAKSGSLCSSADGKCIVHSTKVTSKTTDDKKATIYSYVCDSCEEKLAEDLTVANTITYFTDITKIAAQNSADGKTKVTYLSDNGVTFARSEFVGDSGYASVLLPNGNFTLGQYMAIKYRVTSDGFVQLRSQIGGGSNDNLGDKKEDHRQNEWMVAVVDLSTFNGYKSEASFYTLLYHTATIDIAYVAISNDIADIRALLAEGESYLYRGEGVSAFNNLSGEAKVTKEGSCVAGCNWVDTKAVTPTCSTVGCTAGVICWACRTYQVKPEVIEINPNKHTIVHISAVPESCSSEGTTAGSKCSGCGKEFEKAQKIPADAQKHNVVVTAIKDAVNHTITYKYICKDCGQSVRNPITVPETLAYFDASSMAKGTGITVFKNRVENGVSFVHIESKGAVDKRYFAEGKIQGVTLGKYIAVKYRVTDSANDGGVKFEIRFESDTAVHTAPIKEAQTDGWVVAVADISKKQGYTSQKTATDHQFWFRVFAGASIDIAYVAMSDDMDVILSFLDDEEAYYYRGENLHEVATEKAYYKDGSCAHSGEATCQAKAVCKYCGEEFGTVSDHVPVEIPAVVPTCGSVGYTAGSECKWCGKTFVAPQEIAKDPENHHIIMTTTTG